METLKDGTRRFYDPQTGREAKDFEPWIKRYSYGVNINLSKGIKFYRVDTLQPNPLVVKGIVKKSGSIGTAPKMTAEQKIWWGKVAEPDIWRVNNAEQKTSSGVNRLFSLSRHEWEEKYKDCHATPETDKSLFRKMGKELTKSSLRDEWAEDIIKLTNAYTKSITVCKDALDCLIFHAYTKDELLAIAHLRNNLGKLKDGKYCYINMHRKNYKKKIADGVKHMVSYDFEYNGKEYELKTEVLKIAKRHNKVIEKPYSLKEK